MLSACPIETARLVLTPLVASDAEAMVDVLADERMHEFTGGHPCRWRNSDRATSSSSRVLLRTAMKRG